MRLNYALEDAGWATVSLECGEQRVEMTASYLHDSLRDLASAAKAIAAGRPEVRVVFMDEPGEHQLVWRRMAGDTVEVEVLWYDDWKSLELSNSKGVRKLLGATTVAQVRGQVLSELQRLLRENGEAGYREKWVEHDFPAEQLRELEEAV